MMGANPISIATKVVQDGDWMGAWDKRIQDSDNYNTNKSKTDKLPKVPEYQNPVIGLPPRILEDPLGGDSTNVSEKGKKTTEPKETFRLNELPENKLASSAYSSIVAKLNPVKLASLSAKTAAAMAIPAMLATTTPAQAQTMVAEPDLTKTEYVSEQPDVLDVRIISIADADKLFGHIPELAVLPAAVTNGIAAPLVHTTVQVPEQTVLPTPVTNNIATPELPTAQVPQPVNTIQAPVINIPEPVVIQAPELAVLPIPVTNNIAAPEPPTVQIPEISNSIQVPEQTIQPTPVTNQIAAPELPQVPEMVNTIQVPVINIPEPVIIQAPELSILPTPVSNNLTVPEQSVLPAPVTNQIAAPELPAVQVPEIVNSIQTPVINMPEPVIIHTPELAVLSPPVTNNIPIPEPQQLQIPELAELPDVNGQEETNADMQDYSRPADYSRTVHIDQLNIHIAQADDKGYEQITEEVENALIKALNNEA